MLNHLTRITHHYQALGTKITARSTTGHYHYDKWCVIDGKLSTSAVRAGLNWC